MVLGDFLNAKMEETAGEFLNAEMEETQVYRYLLSLICLYSNRGGMPLKKVEYEFYNTCGFHIPYKSYGADSLRSWILTLPDIYLIDDDYGNEVLIQQSKKSSHIKGMIMKQKQRPSHKGYYRKKYNDSYTHFKATANTSIPEDSFIHFSSKNDLLNDSDTFGFFNKLVSFYLFQFTCRIEGTIFSGSNVTVIVQPSSPW